MPLPSTPCPCTTEDRDLLRSHVYDRHLFVVQRLREKHRLSGRAGSVAISGRFIHVLEAQLILSEVTGRKDNCICSVSEDKGEGSSSMQGEINTVPQLLREKRPFHSASYSSLSNNPASLTVPFG